MAKIVSEKREVAAAQTPQIADGNQQSSPLASLIGLVLTAFFLLGAVLMVYFSFNT